VADVVTVKVVLAAPLVGVTVAGLKAHVIPVTGEQEKETLLENPPEGVVVSMNWVDSPAMTMAVARDAANEKSGLAMFMVTAADALPANFSSPR